MHALTHNTGTATVRNAAQPVRPDEVKYSNIAFINYKEKTLEKFGSVMILQAKYIQLYPCLLSPFAIKNKQTPIYIELNHAGLLKGGRGRQRN